LELTKATGVETKTLYDGSGFMSGLMINYGKQVWKTARSRAFWGMNNDLGVMLHNVLLGERDNAMDLALSMEPNLMAEYAMTTNWLFFGGASHALEVAYSTERELRDGTTAGTYEPDSKASATSFSTGATSAEIGVRYQNQWIGVEACVAETVFNNGFADLFSGANVLADLGVIVKF
jgi:hypothetical protein